MPKKQDGLPSHPNRPYAFQGGLGSEWRVTQEAIEQYVANIDLNSFGGTLGVPKGGTGLNAPGAAGTFLKSDGAVLAWTALAFADVGGVAARAQLPSAVAYEDEANIFTAGLTISGEGLSIVWDTAGLRRAGLVKESGFGPELRYLSSMDFAVRRVTTGTLETPSASDLPLRFLSTGAVLIGTDPGGGELLRVGGGILASGRITTVMGGADGIVLDDAASAQSARLFFLNNGPTGWALLNNDGKLGIHGNDAAPGSSTGTQRILLSTSLLAIDVGVSIGTDPGGSELLRVGGTAKIASLAGTGTRAVVVDANGVLSAP